MINTLFRPTNSGLINFLACETGVQSWNPLSIDIQLSTNIRSISSAHTQEPPFLFLQPTVELPDRQSVFNSQLDLWNCT